MAAKVVQLAQPANPAINQVFDEFLADQRGRLKPRTLSKYEDVLDLMRHHLNGHAYESLSKAESVLFDRHYNAEGDEHQEFCSLFGPDKIVENLGSFLGYFMIRKVMAGQDLKRAAGTVTKTLSKWLAVKGYISEEVFRRERSRLLPPDVQRRAHRKLLLVHAAERIDDVRVPPGNRLERLKGDRSGQHSIRINDQWRICFRWAGGDAFDVEITDYY